MTATEEVTTQDLARAAILALQDGEVHIVAEALHQIVLQSGRQ